MNKAQFKKLAYELGYYCNYSGHLRTFYMSALSDLLEVPGDLQFFDDMNQMLLNSGFNVVY